MDHRLHFQTLLKVTPQLILSSGLLSLSDVALEEAIARESAANPALQVDIRPRRQAVALVRPQAESEDSEELADPLDLIASPETAHERLAAQVGTLLSGPDRALAIELIYSLNEHGFLPASIPELAREFHTDEARVQRAVAALQQLDPPGIGARDVRECLLLQCRHLLETGVDCAAVHTVLDTAWEEFIHQRWKRAARLTGLAEATIHDILAFVRRNLYMYPVALIRSDSETMATSELADIVIEHPRSSDEARLAVRIPGAERYILGMNASFSRLLQGEAEGALSPSQRDWARTQMEAARTFIAAVQRRWGTLRRIGEYLLAHQTEFLDRGPCFLNPATRSSLAQYLALHESTIGRAVNDKLLQLPSGRIIALETIFDGSIGPKEAIRAALAGAHHPLNDRELAQHLRSEGWNLARRTVTKYRHALGLR